MRTNEQPIDEMRETPGGGDPPSPPGGKTYLPPPIAATEKSLSSHNIFDRVEATVAEETFTNSPLRAVGDIATYPDRFFDFVTQVCGDRLSYRFGPMHQEFFDLIRFRQVGIAAPRSFAKSVFFSVMYPLFLALIEPKSCIVFVSATAFLATKLLREVKRELEGNPWLREEHGDQVSDKWREDHIVLKNGSEILARSVTSQIRGLHPTVLILDDAENEQDALTAEGRESFDRFVKQIVMPTLSFESCQLLMIGTILHPESFLHRVVLGQEPGWTSRLYRALTKAAQSVWPHLWPVPRLLDLKRDRGTDAFEQEYMNNPIPDGKRAFRAEWFQWCRPSEVPTDVCRFVTVDPAIQLADTNDDTAIVVSSMDADKRLYVEEVQLGKLTPNEIIGGIFDIVERMPITCVGIETQAFQKTLQYMFHEESRRRKRYPRFEELTSDGRRKAMRILALQPYFEQRQIVFVDGGRGIDQLTRQLLAFPTGRWDDAIDAFAYVLQIARPGTRPHTPPPPPDSFEGVLARMAEERTATGVWGNHQVVGHG